MQGNVAYKMGINTYQSVQKETMSGRETEARVLEQGRAQATEMSGKLGLAKPQGRSGKSVRIQSAHMVHIPGRTDKTRSSHGKRIAPEPPQSQRIY